MAAGTRDLSTRRRGRPFRLPQDASPINRVHGGVNERIAWLLASSRIHASNPQFSHREHFLPALNSLGIAADQARLSRWESGNQRIPDRVVVAYEQLLDLSPGKISAVATGQRRSLEPDTVTTEVVATTRATMHKELDHLFEQAYDGQHGSYWLALTNYLAVHPNIYLRPATWTDLTDKLIIEMSRATGPAFTRRYEALRTLIRHPGAQQHVVRAVGGFVTDPDAQSVTFPLTLLQEVQHPKAQDLLMRLLGTSSGLLQEGAAWAAAAKVVRGHFDEPSLRQLEGIALLMIAAGPRATSQADILDVAVRLPEDSLGRIRHLVRDNRPHARLETMLSTGEVLPRDVTRPVARMIAEAAQVATPPPYRIEPDMMLVRLLREALFHGHQERRHQASVLLTVSPYRSGIAHACAQTSGDSDEVVAGSAAQLLRYLATEAERDDLLRIAATERRPQIRGDAIIALGWLPAGLSDDEEGVVMHALSTHDDFPTQRACLNALGMNGSSHLDDLVMDGTDYQRRAAMWWARIGPRIHESSKIPGQD